MVLASVPIAQHSVYMGTHAVDRDHDLAAEARAALVREIAAGGAWDADPVWREAFEAVPRHLFVPYYYVGGGPAPSSGAGSPGGGGYERLWGEERDPRRRERWLRGSSSRPHP